MLEATSSDVAVIYFFFFCLSSQSKEVGVQLQEDLMKVLNELYAVRNSTDNHYMWIERMSVGVLGSPVCHTSGLAVIQTVFNFS